MRLQLLLATILSMFSLCVLAAPMAQPDTLAALETRDLVPNLIYSLKITETAATLFSGPDKIVGNVIINGPNSAVRVIEASGKEVGKITEGTLGTAIFTGISGNVATILRSVPEIIAAVGKAT